MNNNGLNFRRIEANDADLILKWRTSERVSNFMRSDIDNNLNSQINWINSLENQKYYAWLIYLNQVPIGFINLTDICLFKKTTSWGFYIGDDNYLGYGGLILPYFYNFVFIKLGLEEIRAEVFYNNLNVINTHLKFGYIFDPHNDKVIKKNEKDVLLVSMVLLKNSWNFKKYKNFTSNLELSF